jgi:thioredoxin-related protein
MSSSHNLIKFIGSITLILTLTLTLKESIAQEINNSSSLQWYSDFDQAKKEAEVEGKYMMLYFSGSDWCKPCIQLSRNILETKTFYEYTRGNFVPVKLDFPKMKKNKLPKDNETRNENLAEKYNPNGVFPLLVFLDNNEKMIGFTGYTDVSPQAYVSLIDNIIH